MRIKLFFALLILITLSAIYPVIYYYSDKNPPSIPQYNTYEYIIGKVFPDTLQQLAKQYNCRYYVKKIEKVKMPDKSLTHIRTDLNIVLLSYKGWKMRVDSQEEQEMKKQLDQNLIKWDIPGYKIENIVTTQTNVNWNTRFSADAEWFYLPKVEGDNVELVLSVNNILTTSTVFSISLTFLHPDTLNSLKLAGQKRKKEIDTMEDYADLSIKFLFGFSSILGIIVIGFVSGTIIRKRKEKKLRKHLSLEISNREDLINNGHFVTAYELTEKYLKCFPDDTEIKAFKERLLDFTNNDPKAAQEAFVAAKKLRNRLKQFSQNAPKVLLSRKEKESIKGLIQYHPELDKAYNQLVTFEKQYYEEQSLISSIEEIKLLVGNGELYKSQLILDKVKPTFNDKPEWIHWQNELKSLRNECESKYDKIKELFLHGKIRNGEHLLNEFLNDYKDHPNSLLLKKDIERARGKTGVRLFFPITGLTSLVIFKNEVFIGREDIDKKPDISFDDKRISRNHLVIRQVNGECVIEDNMSTGGTFINGERIKTSELHNGDILNLSKIFEFKVHIYKCIENKIGGIILTGQERNFLIVFSKLSFGISGSELTTVNPGYSIYYQAPIPILTWESDFAVICSRREIQTPMGIIRLEEM